MFGNRYPVLKNFNFLKLILASFISNVGSGVRSIALPFYVFFNTDSYLMMTLMMVVMILPAIIFGSYAGILADRYNRKYIMVISDFYRMFLFILIFLFHENVYGIFLFGFFMTFGSIFYAPCSKAIIPEIVKEKELMDANSINSALQNIASLVGPILGGVLAFKTALVLDSVTFFVSGVLILWVSYRSTEKVDIEETQKKQRTIDSFREVYRMVSASSSLQTVVVMVLILSFSFGMIPVILPGYISDTLGFSKEFYGLVLSLMTAGGILGSLLISSLTKRWSSMQMFITSYGLYGFMYVILAITRSYYMVGLLFVLQGITMPIMGVSSLTVEQKLVNNAVRGKFFGVMGSIQAFFGLFGRMTSGPLAQFTSPLVVLMVSFSLMMLGTLWGGLRLPRMQQQIQEARL